MSNNEKFQKVLNALNAKSKKKEADRLKAERLYAEEKEKITPKYKENQKIKAEADSISAENKLRKAKKEAQPQTPSDDILRYGKRLSALRKLGYREQRIKEEVQGEGDDQTVTYQYSLDYIPTDEAKIYEGEINAYRDSLNLAQMAKKHGMLTPKVREIDQNRAKIEQERNDLVRKIISQDFPMKPGADGETYSEVSDDQKIKIALDQANDMLVKKYGKGILPLLTNLRQRRGVN